MAKMDFKFDVKKIEKAINKELEKVVKKQQKGSITKRHIIGVNKMNLLPKKEEEMLSIILSKYNNNSAMKVTGACDEFPKYMSLCMSETIDNLKLYGYISSGDVYIGGEWFIVLTPDGIEYYEKKGMRVELFEELPDNAKELLKEILKNESEANNIADLLAKKVDEDKTDSIVRGIIGTLKDNGLITVQWADNTVYYAELTNAGRTYFEREKKYMEKLKQTSGNTYNINNSGIFNMGTIENLNVNIDNSIKEIGNQIESKGNEDKQELREILEEIKDYIDNVKETKTLGKNSGLFKRVSSHLSNHGWFYAEVVGLLGQVCLKTMG